MHATKIRVRLEANNPEKTGFGAARSIPTMPPMRHALALLGSALLAPPETVVVKLASPVPEGHSWHLVQKETADEWRAISGGRVAVRLYAGGLAGEDPDVVRRMRAGTLDAGVLSTVGLAEIDPFVRALGLPLMFASDAEAQYVFDKMRPGIEARMEAAGFLILNWVEGGWAHFFTIRPVVAPADFAGLKVFAWVADRDAERTWKAVGFDPVSLPTAEVPSALRDGRLGAVAVPPALAVFAGYHRRAPHMTELRWQWTLGATVIRRATWEKISPDLRAALLDAARRSGRRLRATEQSAARDVAAMKARGLNVVAVDARARQLWQQAAESAYERLRGAVVPAEAFDEVRRHCQAFRRKGD